MHHYARGAASLALIAGLVGLGGTAYAVNKEKARELYDAVKRTTKSIDGACMQTAVGKRDSAIATAWTAFANAKSGAITTRTASLQTNWGMPAGADRRQAIKTTWKTYRDRVKSERQTYNTSVNTAWSTFRTDAQGCGVGAGKEDPTNKNVDLQQS